MPCKLNRRQPRSAAGNKRIAALLFRQSEERCGLRCRSELGPARVGVLFVLLAHRARYFAADFGEGGDGGGEAFLFRRFGDLLGE